MSAKCPTETVYARHTPHAKLSKADHHWHCIPHGARDLSALRSVTMFARYVLPGSCVTCLQRTLLFGVFPSEINSVEP